MYYLPAHVIRDIAIIMGILRKHEVFVEMAVPTAINCLINPEDIEPLQKFALGGIARREREKPWLYFNSFMSRHDHFMHPTKWGLLAENRPGYAHFFCTQVVPLVHGRGRIPINR